MSDYEEKFQRNGNFFILRYLVYIVLFISMFSLHTLSNVSLEVYLGKKLKIWLCSSEI